MKIYVVKDVNREYIMIFTSIRKAKKYLNSDKETLEMSTTDIPVTKKGIFEAIIKGSGIGGNSIGGEFN